VGEARRDWTSEWAARLESLRSHGTTERAPTLSPRSEVAGRELERGVANLASLRSQASSCASSPQPSPSFHGGEGAGNRGWHFPHAGAAPALMIRPPPSGEPQRLTHTPGGRGAPSPRPLSAPFSLNAGPSRNPWMDRSPDGRGPALGSLSPTRCTPQNRAGSFHWPTLPDSSIGTFEGMLRCALKLTGTQREPSVNARS
jgi:hypothetical protein